MNQQLQTQSTPKSGVLEFVPFGAKDAIRLSIEIVKKFVAVKTRSGKVCDDAQAMRFCLLCQAQRLNPFAGDAFLVGYDGKDGPQFSLITAHQAFLKRAEVCEDYDGMESGVIVRNKETKQVQEIEGDFFDPAENDLLGGWATVHHKKRKIPSRRKLRLEAFRKPFGVWQENPAGMIVKCAEADALRSTFPTMLGGLYMQDEMPSATVDVTEVKGSTLVSVAEAELEAAEQITQGEKVKPQAPAAGAQQELASLIIGKGFTFDHFKRFCRDTGNVPEIDSLTDFEDLKEADAKRMLRAQAGLLRGLESAKGVE
jgi:phage recombination protein Bet